METFSLSNGVSIPVIGMGTGWINANYKRPRYLARRLVGEAVQRIQHRYSDENNYTVSYELRKLFRFRKALAVSRELGYILYDTALSYNNCSDMGERLHVADGREGLFLISKCSNAAQRHGRFREEFERTLEELQTDYLDLYLIHWPQTGTYLDAWRELEKVYEEGLVRAIGVSNFNKHHIDALLSSCDVAPMVDEVECHPLLQQRGLREYCENEGIQLIAHTATGKMRSGITKSVLVGIAQEHSKSIAQVVLRWHYQLGDVSICNSLDEAHMKENLNVFDFNLTDEEMSQIALMDSGDRIWPDPDNCDFEKL